MGSATLKALGCTIPATKGLTPVTAPGRNEPLKQEGQAASEDFHKPEGGGQVGRPRGGTGEVALGFHMASWGPASSPPSAVGVSETLRRVLLPPLKLRLLTRINLVPAVSRH